MAGVLTLSSKTSPFPFAAIAIASYTQKATLDFDETTSGTILDLNGTKTTSEDEIVHALAKAGELSADSIKAPSFFALAKTLPNVSSFPEIVVALDSLDDHLTLRTYLIGHDITAADFILWGSLKGNVKIIGLLKNNKHPHLLRWFSHIESLESTQAALLRLNEAKSTKARTNKTAASFALGLQNAEEGKVVTRFPPEPSGYLHIGHAKAALLNQYFARMYKGKLIIRFDDTNPSKEKSEFEETILEDLRLLGVHGDQVTHTSDYFEHLYNLAVQLVKAGKAYADDTEQLQMREERMNGIASKHRDDSVEENLKRFDEMKAGTAEGLRWCIRAKMSVDNPNKAMRDPVIYRCNVTSHHRTGDAWKVYPTYDFACPAVDSLEGVTHALRTNEYRDRNPQYQWMIEATEIRPVNIWDFSRLNFIYTLLSKRKLHWFVDQKLVHGWDDPRFPTVRGIRRRGMSVEAITQFMLAQGPSQAVVSLEWDSIWTANKKVIDPIAPRFWAILKNKQVPVTIHGGPATPEVKTLPKHKKNSEIGEKKTVFSSSILIEQEDAVSFEDGEEVTLMDWGNAIIAKKTTDSTGTITALEMNLHLEGDFKTTKKKITWLSQPSVEHSLVDVTLLDYDYLITKKKLEEDDNVADFVPAISEFKEAAVADANVKDLAKGDVLQFERKGYFIFDGVAADGNLEFILIPDGRAGSVASKASLAATATPAAAASSVPKIPVNSKMYNVEPVYGVDAVKPLADTKMYGVNSLYDA